MPPRCKCAGAFLWDGKACRVPASLRRPLLRALDPGGDPSRKFYPNRSPKYKSADAVRGLYGLATDGVGPVSRPDNGLNDVTPGDVTYGVVEPQGVGAVCSRTKGRSGLLAGQWAQRCHAGRRDLRCRGATGVGAVYNRTKGRSDLPAGQWAQRCHAGRRDLRCREVTGVGAVCSRTKGRSGLLAGQWVQRCHAGRRDLRCRGATGVSAMCSRTSSPRGVMFSVRFETAPTVTPGDVTYGGVEPQGVGRSPGRTWAQRCHAGRRDLRCRGATGVNAVCSRTSSPREFSVRFETAPTVTLGNMTYMPFSSPARTSSWRISSTISSLLRRSVSTTISGFVGSS